MATVATLGGRLYAVGGRIDGNYFPQSVVERGV
jgi:hypothetical protein